MARGGRGGGGGVVEPRASLRNVVSFLSWACHLTGMDSRVNDLSELVTHIATEFTLLRAHYAACSSNVACA